MKLGIRSKLFLISVALISIAALAGGLFLQAELRLYLESRIELELVRQVSATREVMEALGGDLTPAEVDPLCDRLSRAMQSRVTAIAPGGAVIGDSDLDLAEIGAVESHAARPEVMDALAGGRGKTRRWSTTIDTQMLYVAVPFQHPAGRGVVRVASPLSEVDVATARLRVLFGAAGLVGLAIAILMSGVASHLMSRTLRRLADSARSLASGARSRIDMPSGDELGGLAGSLNRMADDIEATVAALATERARFAAVLEGMEEGVIALDGARRITLMNHTALGLLGLGEAPLGEPFIDHLRAPAIHQLLGDPMEPGSCELELAGPPRRRLLARVTPQQREPGCIIVMHDVTSIRHLETVRRDFVANVSHELRTPVSVIRANAETLLDGAMSDPVHGARLLDALHRNAERLSRIIEDLLDLSRLEAGRHEIARGDVNVLRAVAAAVDAVAAAAAEKGIAIACEVAENLAVQGDDRALDQILVNYLDNAVKYTPPSGHVHVSARIAGDRVRIEVADDGPGVAPRHRQRIFERFYRVDPGRSRDMGGTGLGLSIVKHLVDAMGGDAGMEPVEPSGACFWVSLPRG